MVLLRGKSVDFRQGDRSQLLLQRDCREETAVSQGLKGKRKTLIRKGAVLDAKGYTPLLCLGAMLRASTCGGSVGWFINQYFASALLD